MRRGACTEPSSLYDYIYSWKDYAAEAVQVAEILAREGAGEGSALLEAACGTGRYLEHLTPRYAVTGFDLDARMLRQARWRVPTGHFFLADMAEVHTAASFDALLCLFGGVGYLEPERALGAGMASFFQALRPGGVILIEPWVTPAEFVPDQPWLQTYSAPNFKLARVVVPRREGLRCVLDFHYQLARAGARVEQLHSQETLWLHEREAVQQAAERAGLRTRWTREGFMHGAHLLIGRRPA